MTPFFTIITPTIQRESLKRCCESVDRQSFARWEHIVWIDSEIAESWMGGLNSDRRSVVVPGVRFSDYGNTPRSLALQFATGDWVIYLDDDNALAHEDALKDISEALGGIEEKWTIFPVLRHGQRFFNDPPGLLRTDTANMVIRREVAQWPDGPEYEMDGIFCDMLKANYPYRSFPDVRPIINVPVSQGGR